ncbi:MAG: hypothetical protein II030_08395, partial [Treponema sp.]|nr:hypothetical protein [Treponema sp.]
LKATYTARLSKKITINRHFKNFSTKLITYCRELKKKLCQTASEQDMFCGHEIPNQFGIKE